MKKFIALLLLCSVPVAVFAGTDIENPKPIVIPAQEAKTFDLFWVSQLTVLAPTTSDIVIDATILPYRRTEMEQEIMAADPGGENVVSKHRTFTWGELKTNPKLLNAFVALMEAVKEL